MINKDTMSKHTPGPYRAVERNGQWWVQSQHVRHPNSSGNWADVATLSYVNGCGKPEAILFAAAPDLLKALTLAEDYLRNCCGSAKIANFCKAAIDKATGESA